MAKNKEQSVLYIRMETKYKEQLREDAGDLGMDLSTYCRMILIQGIKPRKERREVYDR